MNKCVRFLVVVFLAFVLNVIWEFSHYRLYNDLSGIPANLHLIMASFTDMLIILFVFLAVSLKNKGFEWIKKPGFYDYLIIIVLCLIVAIGIESWALSIGRWSYKDSMPIIFGLGLSPLVQLFVTGILALWAVKLFENYSSD